MESSSARHGESPEQARAYALVYDEAVRALADQRSVLDNLRTRSGVVLSAAAVTTSFFGGLALSGRDGRPARLDGGGRVRCARSRRPRDRFPAWPLGVPRFAVLARRDIETTGPPVGRIQRDLALYMEQSWLANERRMIRTMVWPLRIATLALVIEVVGWVLDLSGIGEGRLMPGKPKPTPRPTDISNPIRPETRGG